MRLKYGVAVAGTHGKTTTTSMVAMVLARAASIPRSWSAGGSTCWARTRASGKGEFLVAEADESDGSFLKLSPTVAVVTNIDREHLDTTATSTRRAGGLRRLRQQGAVLRLRACCASTTRRRASDILPRVEQPRRDLRLSAPGADVSARDVTPRGRAARASWRRARRATLGRDRRWRCPGAHNVLNSLAAIAVGARARRSLRERSAQGLAAFGGVERRFQVRGEAGGMLVVDDYGHHPTEIRATLGRCAPRGRPAGTVVAVPAAPLHAHAAICGTSSASAFDDADVLLLTDIYPAGEEPIAGRHRRGAGARRSRAAGHRQVALRGRPARRPASGWRRSRRKATWC